MVNIINAGTLGGGFKHYSGLLPVTPRDGGPQAQATVRYFHIPAANAAAIFRGDIVVWASGSIGTPGAADMPYNIGTPATPSVVIGNGGGTLLGNQSMDPNITRWVPGDTTSIIAGVVVGFGPITLYQAKNGFQYAPASTECWAAVDTSPSLEMEITMPTVPATAFNLILGAGIDVKANAAQQATRFGISGVSLDPATFQTTSTLPLRLLSSGNQIGNDPTSAGFVALVQFNSSRHYRGGAAFVED
jgi:hypothetical protein